MMGPTGVDFVAHQVRPGDPDYVYDKRVEFNVDETEPSGWDD